MEKWDAELRAERAAAARGAREERRTPSIPGSPQGSDDPDGGDVYRGPLNHYFGFLSSWEHIDPDGREADRPPHLRESDLLLEMELLDAAWFMNTYFDDVGNQDRLAILQIFGNQRGGFLRSWPLPPRLEQQVYDAHLRFMRLLLTGVRVSIVQMRLDVPSARRVGIGDFGGAERMGVELPVWFEIEFASNFSRLEQPDDIRVLPGSGAAIELPLDFRPGREVPLGRDLRDIQPVSAQNENLLRALHLPQYLSEPPHEGPPRGRRPDGGDDDDEDGAGSDRAPSGKRRIPLEEGPRKVVPVPPRDPYECERPSVVTSRTAELAASRSSMNIISESRWAEDIAAHWAPAAAAAAPAVADPMHYGGQAHESLPFVGVRTVGQGSCTAIYDVTGRVAAYVDFGAPLPFYAATQPTAAQYPRPCVCDDPLMILSHWDCDHFLGVRQNHHAYQRRWIVPQQDMGSVAARELYARVLRDGWSQRAHGAHAGGEIYVWPLTPNGGVNQHRWTPWGYIERGRGHPSDRNESGLVFFARVDGPAHPPGGNLPTLPPRPPQPFRAPPANFPVTPTQVVFNGNPGARMRHPVPLPLIFPTSGTAGPGFDPQQPYVCIPGDVAFTEIPSCGHAPAQPRVVGLVATHHGSDSWLPAHGANHIPLAPPVGAPICNRIAYSFGIRPTGQHCYDHGGNGDGHPRARATAAYRAAGWRDAMHTSPHGAASWQAAQLPARLAGAGPTVPVVATPFCNIALGVRPQPPLQPIDRDRRAGAAVAPNRAIQRQCANAQCPDGRPIYFQF